ncbi:MAG: tetratricopeptide repeat protein [Candidatus Auribacterota bacterium]
MRRKMMVLHILFACLLNGCAVFQMSPNEITYDDLHCLDNDAFQSNLNSIRGMLAQPENEFDIARAALTACRAINSDFDVDARLAQIDEYADELRPRIESCKTPEKKIQALTDFIWRKGYYTHTPYWTYFATARFANSLAGDDSDISSTLATKRGNCISLTILYLSLGKRVGLNLNGVVIPGHIFVRYTDSSDTQKIINIETTADGIQFANEDLQKVKNEIAYEMLTSYDFTHSHKETLASLLLNMGILYFTAGEPHRAIALHELALEACVRHPELVFALATEYEQMGKIEKAEELYRQALLLSPRDPKFQWGLGNIYAAKNQNQQAIAMLEDTIQVLTDAEQKRGKDEKSDFQEDLLIVSHIDLAEIYLSMRRPNHAMRAITAAQKLYKDKTPIAYGQINYAVRIYSVVGKIYQSSGRYQEAIEYFEKALKKCPPPKVEYVRQVRFTLFERLIECCTATGDHEKAQFYTDEMKKLSA